MERRKDEGSQEGVKGKERKIKEGKEMRKEA